MTVQRLSRAGSFFRRRWVTHGPARAQRPRCPYGSSDVTAYVQPGCFHHVWAAPKRLELMRAIYNWAWSRAKYHNLRPWRQ